MPPCSTSRFGPYGLAAPSDVVSTVERRRSMPGPPGGAVRADGHAASPYRWRIAGIHDRCGIRPYAPLGSVRDADLRFAIGRWRGKRQCLNLCRPRSGKSRPGKLRHPAPSQVDAQNMASVAAGCCAPAGRAGPCLQASVRRRRKKTSWMRYNRAGKGLASERRSRADRERRSHATPNQVR